MTSRTIAIIMLWSTTAFLVGTGLGALLTARMADTVPLVCERTAQGMQPVLLCVVERTK